MTLPRLAPNSGRTVAPTVPKQHHVPTTEEWAASYSEIERLYIRERRKLRHVMEHMEQEHGFKATTQMYKKRLVKWGFYKNTPRSAAATPRTPTTNNTGRRKVTRSHSVPADLVAVPVSPRPSHHDGLILQLLDSVRIWSVAFFEVAQSHTRSPLPFPSQPSMNQPWPEVSKDVSSTFKLVIDLLDQGHGNLAGRMVRKAFLLIEDMLTLEAPALIWNLLEIMHHMVKLCNLQLFQILLNHLMALVDDRMPKSHPLHAMLDGLRRIVASLRSVAASPTSSSSHSPARSNGTTSTDHFTPLSRDVSFMLERAWILNADILFGNFDPQLSQLYFHINWDSCVIGPPAAIIGAAARWFKHVEMQKMPVAAAESGYAHGLFGTTATIQEDKMLEHLLAPRMDASPPRSYGMLRASSIASLRGYGDAILDGEVEFNGGTTTLLRLLAALGNARFLDQCDAVVKPSILAADVKVKVPRIHAANLACAIKTLMDLNHDHAGDAAGPLLDTVERLQSIVALQEYAHGEANPQVVQEMQQLEQALVATGEHGKAEEVKRSAFHRLESYTQDIPDDFV